MISDGAPNFNEAFKKEFLTLNNLKTRHIKHIRLQGDHNNNKMEGSTVKSETGKKTMRGLKKPDTPILTGYQIFHNYIRPHEGLDGKTPAEVSGIRIEGDNKWMTLIQNTKHLKNQ